MKKYLPLFLILLTAAWLTACGRFYPEDINPENPEDWAKEWARDHGDYEDQKQLLEIYSSDDTLKYSTSDNEQIFYCVKNMRLEQWDYDDTIPASAYQLLTIIDYKLIRGEMQALSRETIYADGDEYYCLSEALPAAGISATFEARIPQAFAAYYMELAGLRREDTGEAFGDTQREEDVLLPFTDFTYNGMLAASKNNRLDLLDPEGSIISSYSDNREIYGLIQSLLPSQWVREVSLPAQAVLYRSLISYQEGRKQYSGSMLAQWQLNIYKYNDRYFCIMHAAYSPQMEDEDEETEDIFSFPSDWISIL